MAHSFFIKSSKKSGRVPAYFMIRLASGKTAKINSGVEAEVSQLMAIKNANGKTLSKDLRAIKERIDKADDIITRCVEEGMTSGKDIGAKVRSIMNADIDKAVTSKSNHVIAYLKGFIKDMQNGLILKNNNSTERISDGSIIVYQQLLKHLETYNGITEETTFNAINSGWIRRFRSHLLSIGLMPFTVKSLFGVFGRMCRYAYSEDSVHDNKALLSGFSVRTPKEDNGEAKTRIALSPAVWESLYKMELAGRYADVRDIVVWGYYSFQRISDYISVNKGMFDFSKKYPVLSLKQQKTGTRVVVPILNKNAREILERRNYEFPQIHRSMVTKYMRHILQRLTDDPDTPQEVKDELNEVHRTILTVREKKAEERGSKQYTHDPEDPKFVLKHTWELVSTHVCRRSAITNARRSRVLTDKQITSMSGHKDLSVFDRYDVRDMEEMANSIVEDMERNTPRLMIAD